MLNTTLKSRELIGKDLGIHDSESPIIKSKTKFSNRAHLMEPFYYIRNIVDAYNNEMKHFKNEDDYISFINESEKDFYSYIENQLDIAIKIEETLRKNWFKPIPILKTDLISKDFVGATMLEIGVKDNPIYEAIKFKLLHDKLPLNQKDFLEKHCSSKYLIERNKIDLDKLSVYHQSIIKVTLDEISNIIMSKVSNILNNKQLMHVGDGTVVYSIPQNVRVGLMLDIEKALDIESFSNINISCNSYILDKPGNEANLFVKKMDNGIIDLAKYSDAEFINFMRYLDGSKESRDDLVIEINKTHCKLNKQLNINWKLD